MELQTERLLLRELALSDLESVHGLHSLPQVDEFNTLGIPDTLDTTRILLEEWIARQDLRPGGAYTFSIRLREADRFIGLIALNMGNPRFRSAEVWYKLHPDYWRRGYTKEALVKLLHFAFGELRLHRVEAGCAVENTASVNLLESVGMTREGRKRQVLPIRGQWVDNYFYALLESDFRKGD